MDRDDRRQMEKERRPEADDRPLPRQEELPAPSNNLTTPERQTDLATAIGTIVGKLPILIFLSTLVFAIAVLYFGQSVLIPVAFALLLTFLLSPLVDGVERLRVGKIPSVIVVVVRNFFVFGRNRVDPHFADYRSCRRPTPIRA